MLPGKYNEFGKYSVVEQTTDILASVSYVCRLFFSARYLITRKGNFKQF